MPEQPADIAPVPGGAPDPTDRLADALTELSEGTGDRRAAARDASRALAIRARGAGAKALASGTFLADVLTDVAPRLKLRDLPTLTRHHNGLWGEALADALEANAAKITAGMGAAVGAAAAAQWFAGPTLLLVPIELMVETLAVALVEVKLLAELHAVYGVEVPGAASTRGIAFLRSWSSGRGVDPWRPWVNSAAMSAASRAALARRAMGRMGRGVGAVIPMLIGAAFAARMNNRATHNLASGVRADLRAIAAARSEPWPGQ